MRAVPQEAAAEAGVLKKLEGAVIFFCSHCCAFQTFLYLFKVMFHHAVSLWSDLYPGLHLDPDQHHLSNLLGKQSLEFVIFKHLFAQLIFD